MKWRYSVGLVLGVGVFLALLSFGYNKEYEYLKEQSEAAGIDKTQTVQGRAHKEQVFCLEVLNGYVVVYLEDEKTIYEYTDIKISDLPVEVQKELEQGMRIEGLEKLYGFLENYTS